MEHPGGNGLQKVDGFVVEQLGPDLEVIVPWREWEIHSREDALAYARARDIPLEGVDQTKLYSRDENLWHISHEGGPLEDTANEPEEAKFKGLFGLKGSIEIWLEANSGVPIWISGTVPAGPIDVGVEARLREVVGAPASFRPVRD